MAEVGKAAVGDAIEKAVLAANLQLVPAEVRDLENSLKSFHVARQQPKACAVRSFVAGFIERLKAQADSQEGLAGGHLLAQRSDHLFRFQRSHHGAEMSLAGQNEPIGGLQQSRVFDSFSRISEKLHGPKH